MGPLSREAARAIVASIREDNGGISPEDEALCPPAILRALKNTRRKLGSATTTLATNLYSKDTRFVYELIQNAEDNSYRLADLVPSYRYLSFSLYPDRIVIDSNEDGFLEEHVKAICSTGESTKAKAEGYIGEKGIGFKSVFKIAKKIHIQSGSFSFSFQYTKDSSDTGLEMITPLDEDYEELPEKVRTRMTLTLLNPSSFDDRVHDLLNVPDTLLLFLNQLEVLYINIYPQDKSSTETTYTHEYGDSDIETITKNTTTDGESTEEVIRFYVTRKEVQNLPPDPARPSTNQAIVVLAFPINEDDLPIIEPQHVFAFLPLRIVGFNFLIQSDFITQASREDVFNSPRNKDLLLRGVAEAFCDAVMDLCNHRTLQYKWMRFLPSESISDEFWKNLRPKIISLLQVTPCLRSWSGKSLYIPSQLKWVDSGYRDKQGQPFFEDSEEASYLSKHYTYYDFEKHLKPLGSSSVDNTILIARLRHDLSKRMGSKMRGMDEDWHTQVASKLSTFSGKDLESLRNLNLIPLHTGSWGRVQRSFAIYFPDTEGIPIPTDLGMHLVQTHTVLNYARKALFRCLGVKNARTVSVIVLINFKYGCSSVPDVDQHISHLHYLWWYLPEVFLAIDEDIGLLNQENKMVSRKTEHKEHIYFLEKDEEYGPHQLFLSTPTQTGLPVHFLSSSYFEETHTRIPAHGKSWKSWLNKYAGVQYHPQLTHPRLSELSDELKYIIKHRPGKLVGLLQRYWSLYGPTIPDFVVSALKLCFVPVEGRSILQLQESFQPTPKLKALAEKLKLEDFPFLILPEKLTVTNESKWGFLIEFCVWGTEDISFYIAALKCIVGQIRDGYSPEALESLFEIYSCIERHCSVKSVAATVRNLFKQNEFIYIPSSGERHSKWVNSEACVWTGPEWLESKNRLDGISKFRKCTHLFQVTLNLPDANWKDFIEDLKLRKDGSQNVTEIYHCLWREFERDSNNKVIRDIFEEAELVFVPLNNTWNPLSSCIWAEDQIQISKMASIKTPYSDLKDFFCRVLGVKKPDLQMHVQSLKDLARLRPAEKAVEIKSAIMLISSMVPTAGEVDALKNSNIFAVKPKHGKSTFTSSATSFGIVDRLEYGSAFAGKIALLEYTVEEVRACRSLLLALGLKGQHLSELVKETTTVQNGAINTELSHNFRLKAYALFRCSVHYHSQKSRGGDQTLYKQLQDATIYVSDGISKSISVVQSGETVVVENSRAIFHLEEVDNVLRLYIPHDKNSREECYFRQLPRRLMTYLGILDSTAGGVLTGIIGCRNLIVVNNILKDAGIIEIRGIDSPSEEKDETYASNLSVLSPGSLTPTTSESRTLQVGRPKSNSIFDFLGSANRGAGTSRRTSSANNHSPLFGSPHTSPSEGLFAEAAMPSVTPRTQDTSYAFLLEFVIKSAENMSIPAKGERSVSVLNNTSSFPLGGPLVGSIFATRSIDRDRKVGAAGELLIFEILLTCGIPGFTKDNWQSTIRKEVSVHNKYRDLAPWNGRETADITYVDTGGILTRLFIEKGYLQSEIWQNERPKYFLEVKTTTWDYTEQFYMSGSQYQRMQSMHLQPQTAVPNVYVILRVFNLEGKISLKVYVDPEASRVRGDLAFHVNTWAVKPKFQFFF